MWDVVYLLSWKAHSSVLQRPPPPRKWRMIAGVDKNAGSPCNILVWGCFPLFSKPKSRNVSWPPRASGKKSRYLFDSCWQKTTMNYLAIKILGPLVAEHAQIISFQDEYDSTFCFVICSSVECTGSRKKVATKSFFQGDLRMRGSWAEARNSPSHMDCFYTSIITHRQGSKLNDFNSRLSITYCTGSIPNIEHINEVTSLWSPSGSTFDTHQSPSA